MLGFYSYRFLAHVCMQLLDDGEEDDDDVDLAWIDDYPKRSSLPLVSPMPTHPKSVQRQLSVD